MTSPIPSVQLPEPALTAARLAEAARYTLLRRLAPSMRHHLVVNLQPIGMVYEVMERRLASPQPDLGEIHQSAGKINGFARAALNSCLDVVSWLAPEAGAVTTVEDGVRECRGLLATSLAFRGYTLRAEVAAIPGEIPRSAIRNVLTAAIIHATDETPPAAELVLSAEAAPASVVLTLAMRPTDGDQGFATEIPYRAMLWTDLEALAAAEAVGLAREGPQLRLTFPRAGPRA